MKSVCVLFLAMIVSSLAYAQNNPVPVVVQPLSPSSTRPGGSDFTLTINGIGFVSGSTVNWNGTALPTTFISDAQLTAAVSATLIANVGTSTISVSNPAPGGGTSNRVYFQIAAPDPGAGVYAGFKWTSTFFGVTSGDFNNDGNLDVAFIGDPTGVFVALGNGDGTFQNSVEYASGSFLASAFAADLNNDGSLDIIGGTYQGSTVSILLNNGDGTLQPPVQVNIGTFMERVAFADLNLDGKLDMLVTTAASTGQVSVLLGNGDGSFQSPVAYSTPGTEPGDMAIGDFNHDGFPDVAAGNSGFQPDFPISVLLGNGDGTLQPAVAYDAGTGPTSITTGDFNGDGNLDLAATDVGDVFGRNGDTVAVLFGNDDGTFQPAVLFPVDPGPGHIYAADVNTDGHLDLVFTECFDHSGFIRYPEVGVLLGNASGTFQHVSMLGGIFPRDFTFGDFNRDGKPDFLPVESEAPGGLVLQQGQVQISAYSFLFGTQISGVQQGQTQKFTLTNASNSPLPIYKIKVTGQNPEDFALTNNCQSTLPGRGSCTLAATFLPTAVGDRSGTISIQDTATGSPQLIHLAGTSVTTIASLFPSSVHFGKVKVGMTSFPQTVTLTNISERTLTIYRIGIEGTDPGDFSQTNTCGSSLSPGAECSFQITFTPGQTGDRFANLAVGDDGGASPQKVMLQGVGN